MPYQGVNHRTIEQMRRIGAGFINRHFRNEQARIQTEQSRIKQEQDQAERAGVADTYKKYAEGIPDNTDEESRLNSVLKTIAELHRFPNYGKEGISQVIQTESLRSKSKPDKANTFEEGLLDGTITKEQYDLYTNDPNKGKKREWVRRNGKLVNDFPMEGDTPYEKPSEAKGSDVEKRQLNTVIAEKKGLEKKIIAKRKGVNLNAILRGEAAIPEEDEIKFERKLNLDTGTEEYVPVPTGKKIPDKDVSRWLELVGRSEELMSQTGEPFTPAEQIADERKQSAGTKRTIPGF